MQSDYLVEIDTAGGGKHVHRFIGGPIDSPGAHQELFAAIGHAATSWARMEQHIDTILIQINKKHHSGKLKLYDPNHPRSFSGKLRLLKRYFNKHPALADQRGTIAGLAGGIKKLSDERNELLHGVLEDFDETSKKYTLNGITYLGKQEFRHRHQTNDIHKILSFTHFVNLAHYSLCEEISKVLFTVDGVARLQTPLPPSHHWWRRFLDWLFH